MLRIYHYYYCDFHYDGALAQTLRAVGEDRVLFSSDYPYEDIIETSQWFDKLELSPHTKRKLAAENMRSLLKL
jgi:gamma-resorcylate decarboxylase